MMKKIAWIIVGICGLNGVVSAQIFTNAPLLKQAATGYKLSYDANFAKALALAKEKGWALNIVGKNGRKGTLVGVDDFGFPKYYMTNNNVDAAATTGAKQLWPGGVSGLGLSGSSANMKNKIGIWDEGIVLATHVELIGRVTQKDNPSITSDHSTHVAGTLIASGVNPSAKGMSFGAPGLIAYDYNNDEAEMSTEAAAGLLISNHSYSFIAGWNYNSTQSRWEFYGLPNATEDYKFGYYSTDSQILDSIAYNAPYYLIVKSAGNSRDENGPAVGSPYYRPNSQGQMVSAGNRPDGISSNNSYDIITEECGAKNILTVGAVNGIPAGYSRKEDVVMSSFSSWGPTDDGRIKPDVVADGVNVLSSISTSTTAYASFSGTSMASPNTAGSLFLLQEYYSKLKSGAFLRSATLKGIAIHTANEAGTTPGPDYQFGWGLLNVAKGAALIKTAVGSGNADTSTSLLYENTLTQGGTFTKTVIASGKGPLQATICWTDVKGIVDNINVLNNRAKNLINDLDIRITRTGSSGTTTYFPWTLDVNNPSNAAARGDNITDNVERIDIDSTVPGQSYTITVTHKNTLNRGQQAYSLLVSGVGGVAYCTSASGGGGARIDSVNFSGIHFGNTAGSKTYTDNTKLVGNIEPSQALPISIRVSTADATTNARIIKVFIDFNNNGTFESTELVTTSSALTSAAQVYNASVSIPATVTIGNTYLMRVIVQETSNASDVNACGTYGKGETEDYRVRVVDPSNDMAITDIYEPFSGSCATNAQYLTVRLKNNGSVAQSNVPITATIATGGTTISNLSFTFPGPIAALSGVTYTFQSPFIITAGATYSITVTSNLASDQNASNNTFVTSFTAAAKPAAVTAAGSICGTTANLKVTNASTTSNYFWYSTSTTTSPFAVGATTSTTTIPADKTYYVAKEAAVGIGPVNKTTLSTSGGYNIFTGNYVKFNNTVPVILQTARLYIGYPGQVRFTVANLLSETATSYSYQPLAAVTIDAYATTTNPLPGAVTSNTSADTGAVFLLDLPVSSTGDHILISECLDRNGNTDTITGATIFRNNNIALSTTYPISVPNVISITGNSVGAASQAQYYYFLYDVKVNTGSCVSDRVAVVATTASKATITQQGDSLVATAGAATYQWYLNDTLITGATVNHYKPVKAGKYKVITTDGFGCSLTSDAVTYVITGIAVVDPAAIGLIVSPNPNNGIFNVSFEMSTKADLTIDLISSSGQKVYTSSYSNFVGKFSSQLEVDNLSSGMYILKIQHDKKNYIQKVLVVQR